MFTTKILETTGNNLPAYIFTTCQNSNRTIIKIKITGKVCF